jgi:hypothetical protein
MTKIAGSGSGSICQRHGSGSAPKCHISATSQHWLTPSHVGQVSWIRICSLKGHLFKKIFLLSCLVCGEKNRIQPRSESSNINADPQHRATDRCIPYRRLGKLDLRSRYLHRVTQQWGQMPFCNETLLVEVNQCPK